MKYRIAAAYTGVVLIWGTTWLGIKVQVQYLPPLTSVGVRFVLAGLLLLLIAQMRGPRRPVNVPVGLTITMAACLFGINYVLNYIAETRISSGLTAILFGTLPFFVFGISRVFGGERQSLRMIAGSIVAFVGVVVVSIVGGVNAASWYCLAAVAAAAVAAIGQVYAKRFSLDPLATLPRAMLLSGIVLSLAGMFLERPSLERMIAPASLAALAYLAVFGSAIAFYLNMWLLGHIKASALGLFALMTPIVALVVGLTVGHEILTRRDLVGSALVLGGAMYALWPSREAQVRTSYSNAQRS